jgi:hypothetical protein
MPHLFRPFIRPLLSLVTPPSYSTPIPGSARFTPSRFRSRFRFTWVVLRRFYIVTYVTLTCRRLVVFPPLSLPFTWSLLLLFLFPDDDDVAVLDSGVASQFVIASLSAPFLFSPQSLLLLRPPPPQISPPSNILLHLEPEPFLRTHSVVIRPLHTFFFSQPPNPFFFYIFHHNHFLYVTTT